MTRPLCEKARDALAVTALAVVYGLPAAWRWLRGDRRRQARIVVPQTNVRGAR